MADHIIHVSLLEDGRLRVPPAENPLEVVPGDTVEWRFVNPQGETISDATIEFVGFLPASRATQITGPGRHPFTSPPSKAPGSRSTVADTARGLYLYNVLRDGQPLEWEVPLFSVGSFNPFFGGIIIRDPQGGS